jgi:hypothetical protein
MAYRSKYQEDSDADADDEYERSVIQSPTLPVDYHESSPTDSTPHSTEHTPTTFSHSRDGKNTPTGLITDWTEEQTADFISDLGLDQYAQAFVGTSRHSVLEAAANPHIQTMASMVKPSWHYNTPSSRRSV